MLLCVMSSCEKTLPQRRYGCCHPLNRFRKVIRDYTKERLYICCPFLGLQTSFLICGCLILTGEFIDQSFVFFLYSLSPMFFLRMFRAPFWSALIYRPVLLWNNPRFLRTPAYCSWCPISSIAKASHFDVWLSSCSTYSMPAISHLYFSFDCSI